MIRIYIFVRKKHYESGEKSMLSANSGKLANPPFARNNSRESGSRGSRKAYAERLGILTRDSRKAYACRLGVLTGAHASPTKNG